MSAIIHNTKADFIGQSWSKTRPSTATELQARTRPRPSITTSMSNVTANRIRPSVPIGWFCTGWRVTGRRRLPSVNRALRLFAAIFLDALMQPLVLLQYPCLEAQGQLPDVLKKALVAFELVSRPLHCTSRKVNPHTVGIINRLKTDRKCHISW